MPPRLLQRLPTSIHKSLAHSPNTGLISHRPSSTHPPSLLKITNLPAPSPHPGQIKILTLCSPHNRNALSTQLVSELAHEINTIRDQTTKEWKNGGPVGQGTRVLIVASALDEVFCAGADLKERRRMGIDETRTFLAHLRSTLSTLHHLPIPSIAAIHSTALGGGLELALACTLRVCANSATLGLPETRLGIIPGAGGTYRLKALVGEGRAMAMVLTGRKVSGRSLGLWGIAENVVGLEKGVGVGDGRERVLERAVGLAGEVCGGAPVAVGAGMRAVREGDGEGVVEGKEYEVCCERGREDREEGLRAFGEGRRAVFRGI